MTEQENSSSVLIAEVGPTKAGFPEVGNATVAIEAEEEEYFYQVEQLTFLWVLFTLIVIGNSTVLIALSVSKGRKSRMNFFIKNLAAADLCVGLISVLTDIIWKITISWEAGLVVCKLIRFSQVVVTYASTYVLVALSIDRYDAITHPMNFTGSWRRAKALVIVAWALSFLFSAPILHFYGTSEIAGYGTQCWIDFDEKWKWRLYMTLVSVTLFVIPAFLIGGCYIIIVVTIWSKGKEMTAPAAGSKYSNGGGALSACSSTASDVLLKKRKRHRRRPRLRRWGQKGEENDGGGGSCGNSSCSHRGSSAVDEIESRRASSRGLIPKAKVKTVKMTFVIIFVFILCWSPYIVFDLLQVYDCIPDNSTNRAVATFIQSLAPLNSAANPLIYCLFSTNAGQNLCSFFGCCQQDRPGRGGGRRGGGLLLRNGRGAARDARQGGGGRAAAVGGGAGLGHGLVGACASTASSSSTTHNTKSTSLNFDSSASSGSSSILLSGSRRSRVVAKNNSVVSWAADATDEAATADESKVALMQQRHVVRRKASRAASVAVNDF